MVKHVTALIYVASFYTLSLAAQAADTTTGPKVLRFAPDKSLGKLEDMNRPKNPPASYRPEVRAETEFLEGQGESLGEAKGDVVVPAGAKVLLRLDPKLESGDLSPLAKLKPDDLYGIRFGHDSPTTSVELLPLDSLGGLRVLDLWNPDVRSEWIAELQQLPALEHLAIICSSLDTRGMANLGMLRSLKGLKIYTKAPLAADDFAQLATLENLRELSLQGEKYDPAGYAWLASLPNLECFHIGRGEVKGEGFEHLPKLKKLKYLSFYDLNGRGVAALPPLPQLEALDISYKGDAFTSKQLESLAGLPNLKYLSLRGRVLDDGIEKLKVLKKLKTLELHGVFQDRDWLTDKAAEHIAGLSQLENLVIYTGDFTDEALHHFTKLRHLKTLHMPNCEAVTNAGIEHLSKMTSLEDLYVRGSGISDESLTPLAQLKSLKSLRLFAARGITQEGIDRLKTLMPGLQTIKRR